MSLSAPSTETAEDSGPTEDLVVPASSAEPGSQPAAKPAAAAWGRWLRSPVTWLIVFISVYFTVSVANSIVGYLNVQVGGTGAAVDLGTFEQTLTSTSLHFHGPFYEALDCGWSDRCSFLLVHPALVLYPLVPVYAALPSAYTLFVLQSLVVALAAVPLFVLARNITRSSSRALLAAGLYLLWVPVLSSSDHSFHLESFMPLELFTTFLLWERKQFLWGTLAAALSFITLDIAPVMTFFFGLFLFFPLLWVGALALAAHLRAWALGKPAPGGGVDSWPARIVAQLRKPEGWGSLGLMAISVAGYILIRLFVLHFASPLLGVPPLPAQYQLPLTEPNPHFGYGLSALGYQTVPKLEFTFFLFASLGFIPLLVPRTLVLAVSVIAWYSLTEVPSYYQLGGHYTILAAVPLMIGFCYGLSRLPLTPQPQSVPTPASGPEPSTDAWRTSASGVVRPRPGWHVAGGVLLAGVIVLSLLLCPVFPTYAPLDKAFGLKEAPGLPVSLSIVPGFGNIERMIATIPSGAVVAASADLFPYVGNNPRAIPLFAVVNASRLPFNASVPTYLLVDDSAKTSEVAQEFPALTRPLAALGYGVAGVVESSPAGLVLLYEQGFTGSPRLFGPSVASSRVVFPASTFTLGRSGQWATDPSSPYNPVIQSVAAPVVGTSIWIGPDANLVAGNYTVALQMRAIPTSPPNATEESSNAIQVLYGEFGNAVANGHNFTLSQFKTTGWTTVQFTLHLASPVLNFEVYGAVATPYVELKLASMTVTPIVS